jgi:hypothetical protein
LDSSAPAGSRPSRTAKSRRTARRSYSHECGTDGWILPPSITTLQSWMDSLGGGESMSSREGSLARISASPATRETDSPANGADSGPKWQGSFTRFDRATSSWRTLAQSFSGELEPFSGTWPPWGLMRNGACSVLAPSVAHIAESGCGLLPTPVETERKDSSGKAGALASIDRGGRLLRRLCVIGVSLGRIKPSETVRLRPSFVESMMGYPPGWTALEPLATASSPRLPLGSGTGF